MDNEIIKTVYEDRVEYRLNGVLHREDGPAMVFLNGNSGWYVNGNLHREDGPAVIMNGGTLLWFINGVCTNSYVNRTYHDMKNLKDVDSRKIVTDFFEKASEIKEELQKVYADRIIKLIGKTNEETNS